MPQQAADPLAELLPELRDIHLPDPVAWWPLAPGWWILLILVVVSIAAVLLWRRGQQKQRFKKQALAEVQLLNQAYQQHYDARRYLVEVSVFLRRLAVSRFPRAEVAGLTGSAWIEFLDQTLLGGKAPSELRFSGEIGWLLLRAPYAPRLRTQQVDISRLEKLLLAFIQSLPDDRAAASRTWLVRR